MDRLKIWQRLERYEHLDTMAHPGLCALRDTWQGASASAMPAQADIDLSAIRPYLPNVAVLFLAGTRGRAVYGFVGDALRKLLGRDPTGSAIDAVYPPAIAGEIYEAIAAVTEKQTPLYFRREFRILHRRFGYHRLMLPLAGEDGTVSRILVGIYPASGDLKSAADWQAAVEELDSARRESEAQSEAWTQAGRAENETWLV